MREILFRGKEKRKNGKWIEGYYERYDKTHRIIVNEDCVYSSLLYPVIPETVGQFTGLTDKNDTKIFEDDIVRVIACVEAYGIYEFDKNITVKDIRDLTMFENADSLEIIGNIYDNPELLEE